MIAFAAIWAWAADSGATHPVVATVERLPVVVPMATPRLDTYPAALPVSGPYPTTASRAATRAASSASVLGPTTPAIPWAVPVAATYAATISAQAMQVPPPQQTPMSPPALLASAPGPYAVPSQEPLLLPLPPLPEASPSIDCNSGDVASGQGVDPLEEKKTPTLEKDKGLSVLDETVVVGIEEEPAVKTWNGSFELGLDGSEGNSKVFNIRFGCDATREMDDGKLLFDFDFRKTTSDYVETANRAFLDWRYERTVRNSHLSAFVHGTDEFDEFQAFNFRFAVDIGLDYALIDTKVTSLNTRLGGGFSREVGGPDNQYIPEAALGISMEHRFSKMHKITATADYMPNVTDLQDYRLRTRFEWEMLISEEMNLSMKFSMIDSYDSTPHGALANDLDYGVMLIWSF